MSAHPQGSIELSVCIPAYNEEAVIADTVHEAAAALERIPGRHEVLVVDDGSTDRTWAILEELAGEVPCLRLLRHDVNRGNATAQRTLVEAARGRLIFHIGADGEWRMEAMLAMREVIERGADIVIGVRIKKQYSPYRKLISTSYNLLVWLLWGKHFGDLGSIKMARASLWKQIPFVSDTAFVHGERLLIAYHNAARIETVPVEHVWRRAGRSSFGDPRKALRALRDLLGFRISPRSRQRLPAWTREEHRP